MAGSIRGECAGVDPALPGAPDEDRARAAPSAAIAEQSAGAAEKKKGASRVPRVGGTKAFPLLLNLGGRAPPNPSWGDIGSAVAVHTSPVVPPHAAVLRTSGEEARDPLPALCCRTTAPAAGPLPFPREE